MLYVLAASAFHYCWASSSHMLRCIYGDNWIMKKNCRQNFKRLLQTFYDFLSFQWLLDILRNNSVRVSWQDWICQWYRLWRWWQLHLSYTGARLWRHVLYDNKLWRTSHQVGNYIGLWQGVSVFHCRYVNLRTLLNEDILRIFFFKLPIIGHMVVPHNTNNIWVDKLHKERWNLFVQSVFKIP